jgi:hypothetical protein
MTSRKERKKKIIVDRDVYMLHASLFKDKKNISIVEPYVSPQKKYKLDKLLEELRNDRKKLEQY